MSDKGKPPEKEDSLWGDIARMEAEINDPEEVETAVYDLTDLDELRKAAGVKKITKGFAKKVPVAVAKAVPRPPVAPAAPVGPPPSVHDFDDEDEEEDKTTVFDSKRMLIEARKYANASKSDAGPLSPPPGGWNEDAPEPTEVMARGAPDKDDSSPAIEVGDASLDDDALVDDLEDAVLASGERPLEVEPEGPESEPPSAAVEEALAAASTPAEKPKSWTGLAVLIVLGLALGYVVVTYVMHR